VGTLCSSGRIINPAGYSILRRGCVNKKSVLPMAVLSVLLLSTFAVTMNFVTAQASTNVLGIITSDTTWTRENSPYNFVAPVTVNQGVTLTIERGVTVNINEFYLEVDGTIKAQGTSDKNIVVNSGERASSTNLNTQYPNYNIILADDSPNSIIENAVFNDTSAIYATSIINVNSVVMNNDTFLSRTINGASILDRGSLTISNSVIMGEVLVGENCSAVISNNTIIGPSHNTGIEVGEGSTAVISHNTIVGTPVGPLNSRCGIFLHHDSTAIVSDNYVANFTEACVFVDGGSALVERNIIENNMGGDHPHYGFGIVIAGSSPLIENNTVTKTQVGLNIYDYIFNSLTNSVIKAEPTIINNNIYNNSQYNIYLGYLNGTNYLNPSTSTASNVNASYNWWGTTDAQAINQTIHDYKNNSNLGTVNFTLFLTAPNPQAMSNPNALIPTLPPTPSPSIPEFPSWVVLSLLITATLLTVFLIRRKIDLTSPNSKK
jgi:hypothetical protein